MNDKNTETMRYNSRALDVLSKENYMSHNKSKEYLKAGENHYRKMLSNITIGSKVLEIGAGMGENTLCLLEGGSTVCATDISSKSVMVMEKKFGRYENFSARVADMENLPFPNSSFDVVCSAGALSYGDNRIVRNEIYRVLKSGGLFIGLDSLNHNPIYKLNRYIHFLKGRRTKNTLLRMPTQDLIDSYTFQFGSSEVKYFGSLLWTTVLLKWFFDKKTILTLIDYFDTLINVKKSAFKFTIRVFKS